RLQRAWAVLEATGRSLAAWQAAPGTGLSADGIATARLVLLLPRERLYAACDARFVTMLDAGALDEARRIAALGLDAGLPSMKALGLRELLTYLRGELPLADAIAAAQQATRNYAKRQTTWFRHQLADARRIEPDEAGAQFSERFLDEIFNFIRESG
ncbi:MAG: tRNA (adenosine(37)-N6)-dimethylallyltransferase MiaA, partial [Dongiaceae bacterium]